MKNRIYKLYLIGSMFMVCLIVACENHCTSHKLFVTARIEHDTLFISSNNEKVWINMVDVGREGITHTFENQRDVSLKITSDSDQFAIVYVDVNVPSVGTSMLTYQVDFAELLEGKPKNICYLKY